MGSGVFCCNGFSFMESGVFPSELMFFCRESGVFAILDFCW